MTKLQDFIKENEKMRRARFVKSQTMIFMIEDISYEEEDEPTGEVMAAKVVAKKAYIC